MSDTLQTHPRGTLGPFLEARATLGVGPDADAATIRRAYRQLVAAHPPDTDAAAFERVRGAYELLTRPLEQARAMLLHPAPLVPPPKLPDPVDAPQRVLGVALIRALAAGLSTADAMTLAAMIAERRPGRKPKKAPVTTP